MKERLAQAIRGKQKARTSHTCETTSSRTGPSSEEVLETELESFRKQLRRVRSRSQRDVEREKRRDISINVDEVDGDDGSDESVEVVSVSNAARTENDVQYSEAVKQARKQVLESSSTEKRHQHTNSFSRRQSKDTVKELQKFVSTLTKGIKAFEHLTIQRIAERAAARAASTNDGGCTCSNVEKNNECSICFSPMSAPGTVLTPCGHMYHMQCILQALCIKDTCPVCRNPVEKGSLIPVRNGISYRPESGAVNEVIVIDSPESVNKSDGNANFEENEREAMSNFDGEIVRTMTRIKEGIERAKALTDLEGVTSQREEAACAKVESNRKAVLQLERQLATHYETVLENLEKRKEELDRGWNVLRYNQSLTQTLREETEQENTQAKEITTKLTVEKQKAIEAQANAAKAKKNYLLKSKQLREREKYLQERYDDTSRKSSIDDILVQRPVPQALKSSGKSLVVNKDGKKASNWEEKKIADAAVEEVDGSMLQNQRNMKRRRLHSDSWEDDVEWESGASPADFPLSSGSLLSTKIAPSRALGRRSTLSKGPGMKAVNVAKKVSLNSFALERPRKIANRFRTKSLFS